MRSLIISERITNTETESFKIYLNEVSKIERLTTDEEYNIAMKAFNGDEKSKQELVTKNLRFVVSVAKQYVTKNVNLEDLVNEGNYGLIKAANRFDPTKGFKFISYAVYWIRRNILEYLTKNSRTIKIPANKVNIVKPINELIDTEEQILSRRLSEDEVIELIESKTDYTKKDIEYYLSIKLLNTKSLDKPFDDSNNTLIDTILDEGSENTNQYINDNDNKIYANKLLTLLKNDNQRTVISKLFGLEDGDAKEMKEIALDMGLSRERIRQIKDQSMRILKVKSKKENLEYMFEN